MIGFDSSLANARIAKLARSLAVTPKQFVAI
jgi:hypothetical protein